MDTPDTRESTKPTGLTAYIPSDEWQKDRIKLLFDENTNLYTFQSLDLLQEKIKNGLQKMIYVVDYADGRGKDDDMHIQNLISLFEINPELEVFLMGPDIQVSRTVKSLDQNFPDIVLNVHVFNFKQLTFESEKSQADEFVNLAKAFGYTQRRMHS